MYHKYVNAYSLAIAAGAVTAATTESPFGAVLASSLVVACKLLTYPFGALVHLLLSSRGDGDDTLKTGDKVVYRIAGVDIVGEVYRQAGGLCGVYFQGVRRGAAGEPVKELHFVPSADVRKVTNDSTPPNKQGNEIWLMVLRKDSRFRGRFGRLKEVSLLGTVSIDQPGGTAISIVQEDVVILPHRPNFLSMPMVPVRNAYPDLKSRFGFVVSECSVNGRAGATVIFADRHQILAMMDHYIYVYDPKEQVENFTAWSCPAPARVDNNPKPEVSASIQNLERQIDDSLKALSELIKSMSSDLGMMREALANITAKEEREESSELNPAVSGSPSDSRKSLTDGKQEYPPGLKVGDAVEFMLLGSYSIHGQIVSFLDANNAKVLFAVGDGFEANVSKAHLKTVAAVMKVTPPAVKTNDFVMCLDPSSALFGRSGRVSLIPPGGGPCQVSQPRGGWFRAKSQHLLAIPERDFSLLPAIRVYPDYHPLHLMEGRCTCISTGSFVAVHLRTPHGWYQTTLRHRDYTFIPGNPAPRQVPDKIQTFHYGQVVQTHSPNDALQTVVRDLPDSTRPNFVVMTDAGAFLSWELGDAPPEEPKAVVPYQPQKGDAVEFMLLGSTRMTGPVLSVDGDNARVLFHLGINRALSLPKGLLVKRTTGPEPLPNAMAQAGDHVICVDPISPLFGRWGRLNKVGDEQWMLSQPGNRWLKVQPKDLLRVGEPNLDLMPAILVTSPKHPFYMAEGRFIGIMPPALGGSVAAQFLATSGEQFQTTLRVGEFRFLPGGTSSKVGINLSSVATHVFAVGNRVVADGYDLTVTDVLETSGPNSIVVTTSGFYHSYKLSHKAVEPASPEVGKSEPLAEPKANPIYRPQVGDIVTPNNIRVSATGRVQEVYEFCGSCLVKFSNGHAYKYFNRCLTKVEKGYDGPCKYWVSLNPNSPFFGHHKLPYMGLMEMLLKDDLVQCLDRSEDMGSVVVTHPRNPEFGRGGQIIAKGIFTMVRMYDGRLIPFKHSHITSIQPGPQVNVGDTIKVVNECNASPATVTAITAAFASVKYQDGTEETLPHNALEKA